MLEVHLPYGLLAKNVKEIGAQGVMDFFHKVNFFSKESIFVGFRFNMCDQPLDMKVTRSI